MALVERFIPKNINKDDDPRSTDRGGNRLVLPRHMMHALNTRVYGSDVNGSGNIANVEGNVLKSYALPVGKNKVIGWFLHNKKNSMVYCIQNDQGNHLVLEYEADINQFNVLLSGSSLGFSKDFFVSQGGIIDDIFVFDDALNLPRAINIEKAKEGAYSAPYSQEELSLIKKPPLKEPSFVRTTDETFDRDLVGADNWQFCTRYVYNDNMISVISPISRVAKCKQYYNQLDNDGNLIDLTIDIEANLLGILKAVEVLYRKNGSDSFFIFHTINNPDETQYQVGFRNDVPSTLIDETDAFQPFDILPDLSGSLAIIENRVISLIKTSGFDIDTSEFSLTASVETEEVEYARSLASGVDPPEFPLQTGPYFKNNAIHSIGVRFIDDFGKTTFVKHPTKVSMAEYVTEYSETRQYGKGDRAAWTATQTKQYVDWTLSGSPPSGFSKYQLCMTKDQFYAVYFQCPVNVLYYVTEERTDTEVPLFDNEFLKDGKVFLKDPLDGAFAYVYLELPVNIPVIPDLSYQVRILEDSFPGGPIQDIVDITVDLKYLVLRKVTVSSGGRSDGIGGGPTYADLGNSIGIEVFKTKEVVDDVYYEIGDTYNIVDGEFETVSGRIDGDAHNLIIPYEFDNLDPFGQPNGELLSHLRFRNIVIISESPSRRLKQTSNDTEQDFDITNFSFSSGPAGPSRRGPILGVNVRLSQGYIIDYKSIVDNYGRITLVNEQEQKINQPTTIGFSDTYIQNSFVNGLNKFRAENQYILPADRSPVRALVKANEVLLAIHERETSSLYIGEGLIREGNDFVLAKTESVIGDDRELEYSYGTINPESVIRVYGHVFFWDAYRGAIVRYSRAGLFPVSNYKMKNYFYQKAKQLSPHKDVAKVFLGYDYFNDELLVTFSDIVVADTVVIPGETWAFNTAEEAWTSRYSFVPDLYGYINNRMFTFKNGGMWEHGADGHKYNNFYGVQYDREIILAFNASLGAIKRLLNIHLDMKQLVAEDSEDYKVVEISTDDLEEQYSYIPAYEFIKDEHKWYAAVLQDVNTPEEMLPEGEEVIALRSGDNVTSEVFFIKIKTNRDDKASLHHVNVVFLKEMYSI